MLSQYELKKKLQSVVLKLSKAKLNLPPIDNYPNVVEAVDFETGVELLDEKDPIKILRRPQNKDYRIASIDSSSRYLRDASINMVLVGAASYSNVKGKKLGPYNVLTPFLGISTYKDILVNFQNEAGIRIKNFVNEYFGEDYKIDDMADELRVESENLMLKETINSHDLVVLDGPLYHTPLELSTINLSNSSRYSHQKAYAKLVEDRISLLKDNIIGVVKRLENSYKLGKIEAISRILNKDVKGQKDPDILKLIDLKLCKDKPYCLVGPIKLTFSSQIISNAPDRYVYYLIVKNLVGMTSFFRIESIRIDALENYTPYIISRISERLIPTYIELADNLSKRVSSSLFILAYEIASRYLSIIHDDKLEYYNELKNITIT
ncbi:hypothetical protein DJ527_08225 [Sulfolobus sp. F1]|nr:hypothetical protein DJ527_08225 [Sulfolobus sp. F1]